MSHLTRPHRPSATQYGGNLGRLSRLLHRLGQESGAAALRLHRSLRQLQGTHGPREYPLSCCGLSQPPSQSPLPSFIKKLRSGGDWKYVRKKAGEWRLGARLVYPRPSGYDDRITNTASPTIDSKMINVTWAQKISRAQQTNPVLMLYYHVAMNVYESFHVPNSETYTWALSVHMYDIVIVAW